MLKANLFVVLFVTIFSITEALSETDSKYWLYTCNSVECSLAFSSCLNCFGEQGCKTCISVSKPGCSVCAEDIFNKNHLEPVNENKYLVCDPSDPFQLKVCHFYCRGQYEETGQCMRMGNKPVCICSSKPK